MSKPDGYYATQGELPEFCLKVFGSWLDAAISADMEGNIFDAQDSLDIVSAKMTEAGWQIKPVCLVPPKLVEICLSLVKGEKRLLELKNLLVDLGYEC